MYILNTFCLKNEIILDISFVSSFPSVFSIFLFQKILVSVNLCLISHIDHFQLSPKHSLQFVPLWFPVQDHVLYLVVYLTQLPHLLLLLLFFFK